MLISGAMSRESLLRPSARFGLAALAACTIAGAGSCADEGDPPTTTLCRDICQALRDCLDEEVNDDEMDACVEYCTDEWEDDGSDACYGEHLAAEGCFWDALLAAACDETTADAACASEWQAAADCESEHSDGTPDAGSGVDA
jgi:hypothetical protein